MVIESIFLVLALIILVLGIILKPLRDMRSGSVSQTDQKTSALLAERERILDALAELDFDNEVGKVTEEIYPLQRNNLLQRGADVLRQLEEVQSGAGGVDDPLEKKTAERRADDDPLEAMIAARREGRKGTGKGKFCHNCGEAIQLNDQFCANCGTEQI